MKSINYFLKEFLLLKYFCKTKETYNNSVLTKERRKQKKTKVFLISDREKVNENKNHKVLT